MSFHCFRAPSTILIPPICILFSLGSNTSTQSHWKPEYGTIFDFKTKDLQGNDFDFADLRGRVLLIVNVACDCGYTKSSYTEMVKIHKDFAGKNFEIVAFPSNQFGAQESRPEDEIKQYVSDKFGVTFPLLQKSDVNGKDMNPIYGFLKQSLPGDITWNFAAKFVVDAEGRPIARFENQSWSEIEKYIQGVLDGSIQGNFVEQQPQQPQQPQQ